MNQVQKWLANHSITAKTAASGWAFLTLAFYVVPQFHDYVMAAYSALPKGIHAFLAEAAIPLLIFWKTQKRATLTAEIAEGQSATLSAAAVVVENDKEASKP